MLRTAADLFRTQGYHGTGVNQVIAESGAPKGSLYFHFPGGKAQLAAESIARGGEETCELLRLAFTAGGTVHEVISAVVQHFAEQLRGSDFRSGCPVSTVALETSGYDDTVQRACKNAYESWTAALTGYLSSNGLSEQKAQKLATVAIASLEGALMLAKTHRDTTYLDTIGEHLASTLEKELR